MTLPAEFWRMPQSCGLSKCSGREGQMSAVAAECKRIVREVAADTAAGKTVAGQINDACEALG